MTQTVQAKCPHCRNVLRIPSEWLNKSMRCKHCKQTFQAKAKSSDAVPIAAPAPKAKANPPVTVAQPAKSATPIAVGAPPMKSSGDPFSFDDADAPESAGVSTPRRRGNSGGTIVLVVMFFFLFVLGLSGAGYAIYKVVNTPQLAQGDNVKSDSAAVKPSERTARPPADGASDKGNGVKDNPDPVTPPADDAKKDKDLKKINPPPKDKDKKKDVNPPKDFVKKDGPKKPPVFTNDPFPRRALLISVNNYLMFNPVHYGSPQDTFKSGYPGSSTSVLRDRLTRPPMNFRSDQVVELSDAVPRDSKTAKAHPTQKSVIETTIKDFVESCREQDRIMIFYAGHATHLEDKKSYLIPISGNVTDPDSLVPLEWVYDQLAKCKAQQKILVLDVFRYSPGRGNAGGASGGEGEEGTMPEDFDKNVLNPPAGVQVWCACQKEQNSVELEGGSAFMQAICHAMQGGAEMRGISDPKQPIPIESMVDAVNKRLKDLLAPEKRTQVSRLTGKAPANEVAYDKTQALPDPLRLKPPTVKGGNVAGLAQINKMLDELKILGSVREARAGEKDLLSAEMLPPFSVKNLDDFKTDGYQNIGELHKRYVDMKKQFALGKKEEKEAFDKEFPLRGAYFEIIEALNESGKMSLREVLRPPTDKIKAVILKEQEPLGVAAFKLERTLEIVKAAVKKRDQETSKRWQANFDFAHARLLARLVYVIEYNYTLARIRAEDLPELAEGQTGWRVGAAKKINSETKTKNYAKETKVIFGRIQTEYPDTPWALLAQREREIALGVQWRAKSD